MAFVDVSGESRGAVKDGGAVLARVHLRGVQQADVPLLAAPVGKVLPADWTRVAGGGAQVQRRRALLARRRVLVLRRFWGAVLGRQVLPQVRLALKLFPTVVTIVQPLLGAGLGRPGAGCVPVTRVLRFIRRALPGRGRLVALQVLRPGSCALRLRLVPPPVRGEVSRAAEHLVTLGTPVLDPDYPGALVLRQSERVCVRLPAQLAHEFAQRVVVPPGRVRSGRLLVHRRLFNLEPEDRRCGDIILKVQFPDSFGFLGGRLALALRVAGGSLGPGGGGERRGGWGAGGLVAVALAGADFQVHRGEQMIQSCERCWRGEGLCRHRGAEVEAPLEVGAVVVLADGAGGAVERLVHRLRVSKLHRFGFMLRGRGRRPAGGRRRLCAHRDGGERRRGARRRRRQRQRRISRCLFRFLLVGADPVGDRVGFLVPFHQKSPRHVGAGRRAEGTFGRRWRKKRENPLSAAR